MFKMALYCSLCKRLVLNQLEMKWLGIELFWLNVLTKKQEWLEKYQIYYKKNCKHRSMIILMFFYWKTLPEIWATRLSQCFPQLVSLRFQ